ncbi:MAG: zinc ribbon domain-containing protein [Chloroflexi bacterium]|nr:zinc ribbon domain-containing protein [Chloroflexota bacterium]
MIDAIVRISLALDANKGAYAVLLGSGVSAAAGVPTGWQIVSDLVTKVAKLEGADAGDDPIEWYEQRYGVAPDYSGLLNSIASSPTERSLLLRSYFEPTEDERRSGLKMPTAAHRTMAQLALSGHVHLFLTTNFDRLLENALNDVGIVPQVLSTPDAISGAVPFGQTRCTVVKLSGDYMDTRIKHTPEELGVYDPAVDSLLDRVIDEYGFIISGWSAEWDTALRGAFERNKTQRYSMFWASRNPPRQDAAHLIELRGGEFVQIKDPDSFFTSIAESLAGLSAGPDGLTQGPGDSGAECHACRTMNPSGAKFCSSCGISLANDCPECGAEASAEARFCLKCGHQLRRDPDARESELPEGLITYLFTDVQGSTPLWQRYPQEMRAVMARHDSLMTSAVEENGGAVVRPRGEGDSIFAVFPRATDAVAAASSAQQLLQKEVWPEGMAISVRMAMHTGESELREHDYYGATVNRAARLRSIAHGGQILVSEATAQLVRDSLPPYTSLRDMGSHRLKDLQRAEQVFQLVHPGLPADFPALNSLDSHPNNLPVQMTSFIGREEEIDEIKALLSANRLVTLLGAGGSGKTRLSQEIGVFLVDEYPDGVWFIGLAALSDPNMLRGHVAEIFNVGEDAIDGYLRGKSVLMIIDNCEHVVAGAASLIQSLLASTGVKVIATSREALNMAGERIFQVPPLRVPVGQISQVDMAGCPSVQLFVERAQGVNPSFQLTTGNEESIGQIVQRLDGIPLAIELAASRIKLLQPAQIASRLDESFKFLTGGPADVLPHHQTLELAIDWSYDMLEADQQTLFRQLSVFRGGFTLAASGAVMGTENEFDALDALGELVDKSLVRTAPSGEETRYNLLEPLRQYAAARISADEAAEADGRHAFFFRDFAETAFPEIHGPNQIEWFAALEREHDNLRAALAWGVEVGDADLAQRTAAALWWFWIVHRHVKEGTEWFDRVLALEGGPSKARAFALLQSGFVSTMVRINDLEGCRAQIREARAQFVELGEAEGEMTADSHDAVIQWWLRDLESSSRSLAEIQVVHRSNGFEWGDAFCGWFLGSAAWLAGDMALANERYTKSLEIYRRVGDHTFIAWTVLPLANISLAYGELDQAKVLYEQSLHIMGDIGDLHGLGAVSLGLGVLAKFRGDTEESQILLVEAQTKLREGSGGQGLSWPISNVLLDTSTHDRLAEATDRYQASLNLPPAEWAQMVCSDGEAWRARIMPEG